MPFAHGSKTHVYFGGMDVSPYLDSADFAVMQETAETTTFASTFKSYIAGEQSGSASFGGFYDPTMLDLESSLGVDWALTSGVLTFCPGGGLAIGDTARLMSVSTTEYAQSSPIGGVIAVKWTPATSAAVGIGQVLHPLATDTNTTTGAEKDDLVASALGWTAHLHVMSLTGGGTWIVKLQDAAISNTYSDVTGGAFTSTAAKSTQRLQGATATTALRRYVRYVATRTGGAGGDSITFQLSYSRNQ
jgi:hypothetical protein